ncbi:11309_t:CDS:2, partial [Gigaspora rosea]
TSSTNKHAKARISLSIIYQKLAAPIQSLASNISTENILFGDSASTLYICKK